LLAAGGKPTTVSLLVAGQPVKILLATPDAEVLVEHQLEDGLNADQAQDVADRSLQMQVLMGAVEATAGGVTVTAKTGETLRAKAGAPVKAAAPMAEKPRWFAQPNADADQKSMERIAGLLSAGKKVDAVGVFRELLADRNRRTRQTAVEGLAALGAFSPLADALGQSANDDVRRATAGELHARLQSEPRLVEQVRRALLLVYPPLVTENLLVLLLGFSADAQADPATYRRLVDLLESEDLPVRELAIERLKEYTGRDGGFKASDPPMRRRTTVNSWRKWAAEQTRATVPPRRAK
ncbi:MAG: hypothetical protein ACRC1K_25365, partial [Planctomycetia bacterium]